MNAFVTFVAFAIITASIWAFLVAVVIAAAVVRYLRDPNGDS